MNISNLNISIIALIFNLIDVLGVIVPMLLAVACMARHEAIQGPGGPAQAQDVRVIGNLRAIALLFLEFERRFRTSRTGRAPTGAARPNRLR